ncbi:MAG TPA: hypothetical protein VE978_20630 [Chitinophagales bacterium]|nr:hypothetical protein [Chitinophagales bacterium]
MATYLLIAGIIFYFFHFLVLRRGFNKLFPIIPYLDTSRLGQNFKPAAKIPNDKLVIVSGVTHHDLRKAAEQSCNLNNQTDYAVMPLITKVSEDTFAITFPYDIDFEIFCCFVNYLKHPHEIFYNPALVAWLTPKHGDKWITDLSENKKVMLCIPEDEHEYNNVFLTTSDNIGYKLGLAPGYEEQFLDAPKMNFIEPHIDIAGLESFESEQLC